LEAKKTQNRQRNLEQNSNAADITISNFKLYYRAIITKMAWYWYKTYMKTDRIE
jgi:hypothetical protein